MHILYHHRTAGDRVEAVHIMGIVRALRQLGHTVVIVSPPGCDPERKKADAAPQTSPAPREGALRSRLKRFARSGPPVLFEIAELFYNVYSFVAMFLRGLRRKPDFVYERMTANSIAPTLLAVWWGVPIVQEVNVTVEIGRLRPLALRRLSLRIERWVVRRAALMITVSETFKKMLVEAGFPEEKILVCQNAVHPEAFDPDAVEAVERPERISADALVVGYVGAFVPYHRLDRLISAAKNLAGGFPHVRWLLVGDGVERANVERMISEAGLREKFWLPGTVAHPMVPRYIKAMDIAVLPSSERFNSPMKLFEYMAMGRAVVVPDRPAIREVITHRTNGILFRADDDEELCGALRSVIEDETLRLSLGRRAREDALATHTWPRVAERILDEVNRVQNQGVSTL